MKKVPVSKQLRKPKGNTVPVPRRKTATAANSPEFTEARFQALVENNESIIALLNEKHQLLYISASATRLLGWQPLSFRRSSLKKFVHPDDLPDVKALLQTALRSPGRPIPLILRVWHRNGGIRWFEGIISNKLKDKNVQGLIINLHDITLRLEAEKKISRALRLYNFLSQVNQMLFRAHDENTLFTHDENTLFTEACRIAVNIGGFRMAWVGIMDTRREKLVPICHAGEEQGYLSRMKNISLKASATGKGPSGHALRKGRPVVCNDIAHDPAMKPWQAMAKKCGYASSMAVPIIRFGNVIGTFNLYSAEKNFFDRNEVRLLEEATGDLSYALENLEREEQRKKAEAAVLESEKRYQVLAAVSPVGIFHTDHTGYTTYVNPHWCKITGMPYEQALGYGWLEAVHPDDRSALQQNWQQATENKELSVSEYRFVKPDGTLVWVMGQAIPERDSKNRIIGYVGTTTDITGRKEAEQSMRDSIEKYRTLVEQASDSIMLLDENGDIIEVNKHSCLLLGYSATQFQRMNIRDIISFDNDPVSFRIQELRAGKSIIQKRKLIRRDGAIVNVEISARQLPDGRILSLVRDLTERMETEQQLELEKELSDKIINSLPGIFYLSDTTPRLLRWNKAFETISGYTASELSLIHPLQFFDPLDQPAVVEATEKTYRSGAADIEAKMICKDGRSIPFYFTGARIDYQGRPAMVGTGIDVSERVKAEALIRESEERYRTLIQQASDAIFIANTNGEFITVNKSACELSQFREEELLMMRFHDFTLAEDLEKNPFHFEELIAGKSVTTERVIKKKDGSLVHVEISAKMLSDGRLLIFVRDISERIKAQNALFREKNLSDTIINSLPGIFYLFTYEGRYLRWNTNFERVTQYTAKEIQNLHPLDLIADEDHALVTQKIASVFSTGEESVQASLKIKSGASIPFYFTGSPIEYEGNLCLMGVGIDFSERVAAQEALHKTSEKLRQLTAHLQLIREEERKRIGREIHDELGQQITAMKMDVSWIQKRLPEEYPQVKTKLKNVITLLDGSNQSIRRILSELRPGILDSQGLIESIAWLGIRFEENTGVPFHFSHTGNDSELPEPIATCIFRVCQEALTNITRYAAARRVKSSLTINQSLIIFAIEDDGKGFDPAGAQQQPSFGLLGMRERVHSLGGHFELQSVPGKGTSINIQLPLDHEKPNSHEEYTTGR